MMIALEVAPDVLADVRGLAEDIRELGQVVRVVSELESRESIRPGSDAWGSEDTESVRELGVALAERLAQRANGYLVPSRSIHSGRQFEASGAGPEAWTQVRRLFESELALEQFVGAEVQLLTTVLPLRLTLELADAMLIYGPRLFRGIRDVRNEQIGRVVDRHREQQLAARLAKVAEHSTALGPRMHERGSDSRGLMSMKAARWLAACTTAHELNRSLTGIAHGVTVGLAPELAEMSAYAGSLASDLLAVGAATAQRKYLNAVDDLE